MLRCVLPWLVICLRAIARLYPASRQAGGGGGGEGAGRMLVRAGGDEMEHYITQWDKV